MKSQWRKKPIMIEAIQFRGYNRDECIDFTNNTAIVFPKKDECWYLILPTLEGNMVVNESDWIIKGTDEGKREFYPCKNDVFLETYENVED